MAKWDVARSNAFWAERPFATLVADDQVVRKNENRALTKITRRNSQALRRKKFIRDYQSFLSSATPNIAPNVSSQIT